MVKVFWATNLVDIYMKIRIRKMNAASRDGKLDFYNRMNELNREKWVGCQIIVLTMAQFQS